jgi:type I restriction-modification system DNA methylase subunit
LRGDYKQSDYGKVILPFTVLRRLDCVLGQRDLQATRTPQRQMVGLEISLFGRHYSTWEHTKKISSLLPTKQKRIGSLDQAKRQCILVSS